MKLTRKLPVDLVWARKGSSLVLLLFLVGCSSSSYVELNENRINIEIVDNDLERAKGLMFRENLCSDCGMLFVYEKEDGRSFWMKNTLIPLKIIFIDENFIITKILEAEPCKTDICETYEGYGKYVLEVNPEIQTEIGDNVRIHL